MVNLGRTCVLFFYYFVYFKVNLDLKWINQRGESSPKLIFAMVNLDPIVLEKRWTDGESWPNDFVEKVKRGEDLRWVGSRCPLTHALDWKLCRKWPQMFPKANGYSKPGIKSLISCRNCSWPIMVSNKHGAPSH